MVPGALPDRGVPAHAQPGASPATRSPSRPAATTCSTPAPPERMARHLPDVRILAMLRDPVERAYSAYKHELARGFETESFERALELEDERLAGPGASGCSPTPATRASATATTPTCAAASTPSSCSGCASYFPAEQIHVIESESFFEQPETTYGGVLDFLEPAAGAARPRSTAGTAGRARRCRRRRAPGCASTSAATTAPWPSCSDGSPHG